MLTSHTTLDVVFTCFLPRKMFEIEIIQAGCATLPRLSVLRSAPKVWKGFGCLLSIHGIRYRSKDFGETKKQKKEILILLKDSNRVAQRFSFLHHGRMIGDDTFHQKESIRGVTQIDNPWRTPPAAEA